MKFKLNKNGKIIIALLVVFIASFVGTLLTESKSLTLVEDDGIKYQSETGEWNYTITTTFDGENIGEASIIVDFYDATDEKIYEYNQTLLKIEGNTITSYYTMEEEAYRYKISDYNVKTGAGIIYYVLLFVDVASVATLLIMLRKLKKEKTQRGFSNSSSSNSVRNIRVFDKEMMSKKEAPNFEELVKKSDEQIRLIKEGKKDGLNVIEARYLGYGIDLINWAKEKLNMEFTLVEEDINKLDDIIKIFKEANGEKTINDEMKDFLVWGIAGVFGIIAGHYKNTVWLDDNDRQNGHKLLTKYIDGKNREAQITTFVEAKAARLIHHLVEDETMISLYYSLPYADGSIPFKEYTLEEYQKLLQEKENDK